jgi:hypothetical protein
MAPVMNLVKSLLIGVICVICGRGISAQSAAVDVSKIGPTIGAVAPAFSGTDQNGATLSLKTAAGPKGTMLVFFRSADW